MSKDTLLSLLLPSLFEDPSSLVAPSWSLSSTPPSWSLSSSLVGSSDDEADASDDVLEKGLDEEVPVMSLRGSKCRVPSGEVCAEELAVGSDLKRPSEWKYLDRIGSQFSFILLD